MDFTTTVQEKFIQFKTFEQENMLNSCIKRLEFLYDLYIFNSEELIYELNRSQMVRCVLDTENAGYRATEKSCL